MNPPEEEWRTLYGGGGGEVKGRDSQNGPTLLPSLTFVPGRGSKGIHNKHKEEAEHN